MKFSNENQFSRFIQNDALQIQNNGRMTLMNSLRFKVKIASTRKNPNSILSPLPIRINEVRARTMHRNDFDWIKEIITTIILKNSLYHGCECIAGFIHVTMLPFKTIFWGFNIFSINKMLLGIHFLDNQLKRVKTLKY